MSSRKGVSLHFGHRFQAVRAPPGTTERPVDNGVSAVPAGTHFIRTAPHPALKRWAIVGRPGGLGIALRRLSSARLPAVGSQPQVIWRQSSKASRRPCSGSPLSGLNCGSKDTTLSPMPMTLDQIFLETQQWPTEQVAELVDRLILELPSTPEIEAAWKVEARRRIADIESGRVTGVPGELVSARIREIVGR